MKFKNYFSKDLFLCIRGNVRTFSHLNSDGSTYVSRPVVKINEMMMLNNVLDRYAKRVCFTVGLEHITMDFCHNLESAAKKCKGGVPVEAKVVDSKNGLDLTMKTRDLRVDARKFLPILSAFPGVDNVHPEAAS